jgi:hypothetical protein
VKTASQGSRLSSGERNIAGDLETPHSDAWEDQSEIASDQMAISL